MNEFTFLWVNFLWGLYLCFRQRRVYKRTLHSSLPAEVKEIIDQETFVRSKAYSTARVDFVMLKTLYDTLLHAGFIVFNGYQLIWGLSESYLGGTEFAKDEVLLSCMFVFLINSFNTLAWLPVEICTHFVLEENHGFNRLTLGFYTKDKLKGFLFSQIAMISFTFVALRIALAESDYVFLRLWIFLVLVVFLVNALYPDFIAPIFDTFHPLPEGRLKDTIRPLADSVGFSVSRMLVLDTSRRTNHSDAFHAGIFKSKRIVLFDTLLEDQRQADRGLREEEVLAVVGHELGHWKNNHILKLATISLMLGLIMLVIYGPSVKEKFLLKNFGFDDHPVFWIYFVFVYLLPSRVGFLSVSLLWVNRSFESEADAFVGSLGMAAHLRQALIKVHRDNLLFPVHDWLYSMSYLHHPSLLERLQALHRYD